MAIANQDILSKSRVMFKNENTLIRVASDEVLGDVIIKTALEHEHSFWRIARILNEHYVLSEYLPEFKSNIITDANGNTVLIRKSCAGIDLSQWIQKNPFEPVRFLKVFSSIAENLAYIHEKRLIHRDINPYNVIIDDKDNAVIIDFDISSEIDSSARNTGNTDQIEGNLKYISPEQTGRINRTTDQRTDLYALGATAYELFTGKPMFENSDPAELVHCHIARKPVPAIQQNSKIPPILSQIIGILISKDPEDRYQSAAGLAADLKLCKKLIQENGDIEKIVLKQLDSASKLYIPEKLYGRENEMQKLTHALNSVLKGNLEIATISGFSGVGKTVLVNELLSNGLFDQNFYFSGKFEKLNRHIPYFAWLQICDNLMRELLALPPEQLEKIKLKLRENLGDQAKVLTAVIPQLELLLDNLEDVPSMEGQEAQNRFNYQVVSFVKTLAEFRPLILFLDDVQWADAASMTLLRKIAKGCFATPLFVICAYRENEVESTHPFKVSLNEIQSETGLIPTEVLLENLSRKDVEQLIGDTFNQVENQKVLADLVFERTQGNSFSVKQFLYRIFKSGLIRHNIDSFGWNWDLEDVTKLMMSTDVADLLSNKLLDQSESVLRLVKLAACVGSVFHLNTLSTVSGVNRGDILIGIMDAIKAGLIIPGEYDFRYLPALLSKDDYNPSFSFVHDRIQQSSYDLLTQDEQQQSHSSIAHLLLNTLTEEERHSRLFEIVNHLNKGVPVESAEEKHRLMTMNYQAGLRSLKSVANLQAIDFFANAYALLPENAIVTDYHEWLKVNEKMAESASFSGDRELMEQHCNLIIDNAHDKLDSLKVLEIKINFYFNNNLHDMSANIAIQALEQLGIIFPKKISKITIILHVLRTKMVLNTKKIDSLSSFPHMKDQTQLTIMRISRAALPSFLSARADLYPLLICNMVRRSVKFGNCAPSIAAYGSYSIVVAGILGEIKNGTTLALETKKLVNQFNEPVYQATAEFIYNFFILHWQRPLREAQSGFMNGYVSGLLSGNSIEGVFCLYMSVYYQYCTNKKLSELQQNYKNVEDVSMQYYQSTLHNYSRFYSSVIKAYRSGDSTLKTFDNAHFQEQKYIDECIKNKDSIGLGPFYLEKAKWELLYGRFSEARIWIDKFDVLKETMVGNPLFTAFIFFQGFTLALEGDIHAKLDKKASKLFDSAMKSYGKWSKFSPVNYSHRLHMLYALNYWKNHNLTKAEKEFELALDFALRSDMTFETGLFHEIAARFFESHGNELHAQNLRKQALVIYSEWGAASKVHQITDQDLLPTVAHSSFAGTGITTGRQIDIETVLKSAQALSGEIILENLIDKMLRLVIENAGARNGYFIAKRNTEWYVEDKASADSNAHFEPIKLEECTFLPANIIRYAINSHDTIVINDAASQQMYKNDPYFSMHSPKSMLCMPFIHQGNINSVVFLENDLAYDTFTAGRLQILNLLSGQIAVSVENAQLYANLEDKVKERTAELENEKAKSEKLLLNILPEDVAEELKINGKSIARKFNDVSVMFTDFVNFTQVAEDLEPEVLVAALNTYYEAFDEIVGRHGVEKIKTVGDSYLCVAGLPVEQANSSEMMVKTAIEFVKRVKELNIHRANAGQPVFELRLGINTGAVVAGVVGTRKFAYDIWGDTVNTAARMEQSSKSGHINISGSTYNKVKHIFDCEHRGKIAAKNKGEIDMYFVLIKNEDTHASS